MYGSERKSCYASLARLLFSHREIVFSTGACKGFHIRRVWKYRPHVYTTRHSHLYHGILSTSRCHLQTRARMRSCFVWINSPRRGSHLYINNRINAIYRNHNERYFSRIFKNASRYIFLSGRSRLDCARIRIRIFADAD